MTPQPPGPEWFEGISLLGGVIEVISLLQVLFTFVADSIRGVYLLGDYLAQPFSDIALWLADLINYLNFVNRNIGYYIGWLDYILVGEGIPYLIWYYLPDIWDIYVDPLDWLINSVLGLYAWFIDFLSDPLLFISSLIGDIGQDIADFLNDPLTFIYDLLTAYFPFLADFLNDPLQWIINELAFFWPEILQFFEDPITFILTILQEELVDLFNFLVSPLNWIIDLLSEYSSEFRDFIEDPLGYIESIINSIIDSIDFSPFQIGLVLLDRLLDIAFDNLYWIIDKLEDLIVEFVLERI